MAEEDYEVEQCFIRSGQYKCFECEKKFLDVYEENDKDIPVVFEDENTKETRVFHKTCLPPGLLAALAAHQRAVSSRWN